jgi:hypothetical protein
MGLARFTASAGVYSAFFRDPDRLGRRRPCYFAQFWPYDPMTDREKILIALREKPLKAFEIMKRVNIKNQDDCQSLLLKMRDDGVVKFDIHKGYWLAA